MNKSNEIPIFFAVDNGYIPFLAVTLQSLVDNSSPENNYVIKVLSLNVTEESKEKIYKYERKNVDIEFVDLETYAERLSEKLYVRDYYSKLTF